MTAFEQKWRSIWNGLGNIYTVPIEVLPKTGGISEASVSEQNLMLQATC